MASILKYPNGYRAQVFVGGVRKSKTFRTKREAEAWAFSCEESIKNSDDVGERTLRDAITRYRKEVSPGKGGSRWENIRLTAFLESEAHKDLPLDKRLGMTTPEEFGRWRDERMKVVSAGAVLRDFGLLSSVIETARREWRWLSNNPLSDVRKPRAPDHRETLIHWRQIKEMLKVMGYSRRRCDSTTQAICVAFLLALRTGMRAGELCALRWEDVKEDCLRISATEKGAGKSSSARRDIPLVIQSQRLIASMKGWSEEKVFGLASQTLDARFRFCRTKAGLSGFTFHDSRHVAATILARKVPIMPLCKMFGWKNTKHALIYYNPTNADLMRILAPNQSRK